MEKESLSRDEVADKVHHAIIAQQNALTHLWASVLAVEVVDVAPGGETKRQEVLNSLNGDYLRWKESQASLDEAFQTWTTVVGVQQHDIITAREWLLSVCPDLSDAHTKMTLISDHDIALQIQNNFDREACERTRRIAGLPAISLDDACNCLVDCPAIDICPLFCRDE